MISMLKQMERLLNFVRDVYEYNTCKCEEDYTCFRCEAYKLLHDEPVRTVQIDTSPGEVLNPSYPRYL